MKKATLILSKQYGMTISFTYSCLYLRWFEIYRPFLKAILLKKIMFAKYQRYWIGWCYIQARIRFTRWRFIWQLRQLSHTVFLVQEQFDWMPLNLRAHHWLNRPRTWQTKMLYDICSQSNIINRRNVKLNVLEMSIRL